jgi:hypothetical protein
VTGLVEKRADQLQAAREQAEQQEAEDRHYSSRRPATSGSANVSARAKR